MKVGILGAGVSGLSIARLLQSDFEVEILERNSVCGGIARTKQVNGITYHKVGGHCFNSKYPEVLDFVFNKILPFDKWRKIERKSKIIFNNHEISYPIEFAVKEIYQFDPELAINISRDFLSSCDKTEYENLGEWFKYKFGKTLAEKYFIPYNTKIWGRDVKDMKHTWVQDKLPIPNKKSFFNSLISTASDNMPHSSFYYPKSNDQNTFLEALALGINIQYNVTVDKIRKDKTSHKWIVNDRFEYDLLINTTPLDKLPSLIDGVPDSVNEAASLLKYNRISNVLWETKMTDKSWTYLPENNTLYHRYIHIGSFFNPVEPFSIAESIGKRSYEELIKDGSSDSFLIKPMDYNQSEHAYVVFDDNYDESTYVVKDFLNSIGLYTLGRFGEWQYYNMDVCIKKSMELAEKIAKKYKIDASKIS